MNPARSTSNSGGCPCRALRHTCALIGLVVLLSADPGRAQDRTVLFDVGATGVSKSIPTWGLDTAWLSEVNVRRGVVFMGQPQVDVIRFSFTADRPLTNGNLNASALTEFNARMAIVNNYTAPGTALYLNNDSDFIDAYYQTNGVTIATNWANLINATRQQCVAAGRTVLSVAPFNEPDFGTAQGNIAKLGEICWYLRTNSSYGAGFANVRLCGGSTLNTDQANPWYNPLSSILDEGNTHQLAGSFNNYAAFYQNVASQGDLAANDELHNVMEAMVGAEYGMDAGIWWGSAERARGEFVKASDGQRLGYAEHRPNWTAASVYRAPSGKVQAFVGESERQALPTTYRFFSKDRDVFYDGDGPRRDYTVTTTGGAGYQTANHRNAERVVNVSWGPDVQPAINGRYIMVARHSNKVMEVAGASTNNGANIQQNTYNGGTHQQWDINPLPSTLGGDYSYFSIRPAHSGKSTDINNFSLDDGGNVMQWENTGAANQQWFLEYISNGWFNVRSRWSGKSLDVAGVSTADGANIHQWAGTGALNQQWRFIPVGASPTDLAAPAVVTGVSATANARSVQLNWNVNAASDLAGYTVIRSTTNGGPYEIVARGSTNNFFTDKSANQNKTYYYVVKAMDRSWNSSGNSAQVNATPTSGPTVVARHAFDGTLGDGSNNANHPIVTNGSPTFVAGKYGSAADLDGATQSMMLPANMLVSVTNFTIAMWVNWDGGSAWQRLFDFGNDTTQYMFLTPSSGNGTLRFAVTTNGGGAEQILQTASALPTGQWVHVAVTRNDSVARLYTNGVLAATNTVSITPAGFNPALNYVGESQYEADPLFNGRLDDLFIYNYALGDADIVALANHVVPATPAGLAATSGDGQVGLSWNVAPGAISYNVKRATTSGGPYSTITNVAVVAHTDMTVSNGMPYYYVVAGVNSYSEGAHSIQVSALPVSTAPVGLSIVTSGDLLNLSWPFDHTGWRLQTQTNELATGLGTNWLDVAGSTSTNSITVPVSSVDGSVFFRLMYP
jgi:hypothetical protein